MGTKQPSLSVGALVDAVLAECGDQVRAVATYTRDDYTLRYASPDAIADYGGEEGFVDQGDRIHGYFSLDFSEQEMYADVLPHHGEPRASVNVMEGGVVVRYYLDDRCLFVTLDADASVDGVLAALADVTATS